MCENNSWGSSYSGSFSPFQSCSGLIGKSPEIGYYSYTQRCAVFKEVLLITDCKHGNI